MVNTVKLPETAHQTSDGVAAKCHLTSLPSKNCFSNSHRFETVKCRVWRGQRQQLFVSIGSQLSCRIVFQKMMFEGARFLMVNTVKLPETAHQTTDGVAAKPHKPPFKKLFLKLTPARNCQVPRFNQFSVELSCRIVFQKVMLEGARFLMVCREVARAHSGGWDVQIQEPHRSRSDRWRPWRAAMV